MKHGKTIFPWFKCAGVVFQCILQVSGVSLLLIVAPGLEQALQKIVARGLYQFCLLIEGKMQKPDLYLLCIVTLHQQPEPSLAHQGSRPADLRMLEL